MKSKILLIIAITGVIAPVIADSNDTKRTTKVSERVESAKDPAKKNRKRGTAIAIGAAIGLPVLVLVLTHSVNKDIAKHINERKGQIAPEYNNDIFVNYDNVNVDEAVKFHVAINLKLSRLKKFSLWLWGKSIGGEVYGYDEWNRMREYDQSTRVNA